MAKKKPKPHWEPDWVCSPGETLQEWLDWSHLPKRTFTNLYAIPEAVLEGLLAGTEPLTPELAEKLYRVTFVRPAMWLALEQNFREGLAAGKIWIGAPR